MKLVATGERRLSFFHKIYFKPERMRSPQLLLETQLNYKDVTDSLRQSLIHKKFSSVGHISIVVDRFWRSLRFYYLEFDKEAISDGFKAQSFVFRLVKNQIWIFRELSLWGPFGPCFFNPTRFSFNIYYNAMSRN